jgi:uridine kinase
MQKYFFLNDLNGICGDLLKHKDRLLICITGKSGVGKSTLGKYIRKNGFGDFSKYSISVIDDGVMSLDLFYILNKRVKMMTTLNEELLPFIKLLPKRKKLIFFIATDPSDKITFADVLIHVKAKDEKERLNRLVQRDNEINSSHHVDSLVCIENICYTHFMNIEL